MDVQNVLIHLGKVSYEMVLRTASRFIGYFESLANIFMNTYSVYHEVRKHHEAMFRITLQSKDKSVKTYLKCFIAELVEVEKSDDMLATMVFKQSMYVHSPFPSKLNKRKHDYATLVKCFDITGDLTDWMKRLEEQHLS